MSRPGSVEDEGDNETVKTENLAVGKTVREASDGFVGRDCCLARGVIDERLNSRENENENHGDKDLALVDV